MEKYWGSRDPSVEDAFVQWIEKFPISQKSLDAIKGSDTMSKEQIHREYSKKIRPHYSLILRQKNNIYAAALALKLFGKLSFF